METLKMTLDICNWGPWHGQKSLVKESIDKTHEKLALEAIRKVWRLIPKDSRFYEYDFSNWMDNDEHTQKIISQLAQSIISIR